MSARFALILICTAAWMFPGAEVRAQISAAVDLLDSPVKMTTPAYGIAGPAGCSVTLPGTPALFGVDTVDGTAESKLFVQDELFSPFRVFEIDETCAITATYSTALASSTMTGIAVGNSSTATYWVVDPVAQSLESFDRGTGLPSGNPSVSLPSSAGLYGALVIDDNQPGDVACVSEIVSDVYICIDLASGLPECSFTNADNFGGAGAFGNGLGDADDPSECSDATLVVSSGTLAEGQVTRVGQYDCAVADPACSDRWDVTAFSTFINGIEETSIDGETRLVLADNVTATFLITVPVIPEPDCQDIDPDMDLVWINGSQGGTDFTVQVRVSATVGVANRKTTAGNGRFVHQMHAGRPSAATVTTLFDLGDSCFDFLGGGAVVIESNVGRTSFVGTSNYFGETIDDPARAPTFLGSLTQASIDAANLAAGTDWTHQAIHLNAAASSAKGGSLTNAVVMQMQ